MSTNSITDILKSLLETGMGVGGFYPDVKSVHIGESTDLILNDKYPVILIASDEDTYDHNGNHFTVERSYGIVIHVLGTDIREAERIRDKILLDEFSTPVRGLIPFLLQNPKVSVNSVDYYVEVLTTTAATGKDTKSRAIAAAEIPIKLERKFTV